MIDIRILSQAFDPEAEQRALRVGRAGVGALVTFVGLMRDFNDGCPVLAMTLEHYPGMTERVLMGMAGQARQRWALDAIRILHRVGRLEPCEPIVLVAVTGAHRDAAFRGCEYLIDELKVRAPFWKKERRADGSERWVAARVTDARAARCWRDE